MSKADQLGAGRFGGGARPVSARRQAVAAATGVPTDGVAPPSALSPDRISLNPDNPRSSLGDLTDLAGSLKTHGQKQAITVMNRDAYVKANPDRAADLEQDATYVVIDGSSRLAAAREAGLATIKVMVSDDEGNSSEELLESALVANIHRQDLEELDEARALQRLLAIHGSQTALAKRLHRSQGWVSQRLALLNLTPELQAQVSHEPIDLLRAVGNKPPAEQATALQALKEERARKEEERKQRRVKKATERGSASVPVSDTQGDSGDDPPEPPAAASPVRHYDVIEGPEAIPVDGHQSDADPAPTGAVPEPRSTRPTASSLSGSDSSARKIPYDAPGALAMLLDKKIESDDVFFTLLRFLGAKAATRDPVRLTDLLHSLAEEVTDRAK
ncbi:ParB/RepB/Spo0J family partition protein [Streptomyces parvulus]|uniref:ParB/RepB/Spo0J family partition protein n=1 Tax=Streptomyces parvulus TaxID=146923 RepID=A0A369UV52_9ACTN|nr:ParB/RepB/Spo0J family partition protein [Streptomyces parvulus]RDD84347.1 ParB/RepB/Spo0J family partition protein [Streptomyces parvulus]